MIETIAEFKHGNRPLFRILWDEDALSTHEKEILSNSLRRHADMLDPRVSESSDDQRGYRGP